MPFDIKDPIAKITKRLNHLEEEFEKNQKNWIDAIGKWGGIIALFLSLITGFYTVVDNFVTKPKKIKEEYREKLMDIMLNITRINQYIFEKKGNMEIASFGGLEKKILIESANDLINKLNFDGIVKTRNHRINN